jgi:hypothetical protein
VDIPVIEKVFKDAPTIIQRNLIEEKALKYKEAIERNGPLCRIEKEIPPAASPPEDFPQPHPTLYTPQTTVYTPVEEPVKHMEGRFKGTGKTATIRSSAEKKGTWEARCGQVFYFFLLK